MHDDAGNYSEEAPSYADSNLGSEIEDAQSGDDFSIITDDTSNKKNSL